MAPPEGVAEEEASQTYYVIKVSKDEILDWYMILIHFSH